VLTRRKSQKGSVNIKSTTKIVTRENQNKFGVLQVEEMELEKAANEEEPGEPTKRAVEKDMVQTIGRSGN